MPSSGNSWYDPRRGSFTQEDPIGLAGGMNLYGFAAGDPVNFSDPLGLCPPEDHDTWDCGSTYYANRIAKAQGIRIVNEVAGVINQCFEDERCGSAMMLMMTEGMGRVGGGSVGLSTKEVGEEPLSVNQMDREAQRGQAPRGIRRVDVGKVKGEQDNVHFDDGRSLNRDGTWKHGEGTITATQREWLQKNGWKTPN
jgi:hypothetical protein